MNVYSTVYTSLLWDLEPYNSKAGFISSDMTPQQVAVLALTESFYKKLCPNGSNPNADLKALSKFKAINDRISDLPFEFPVESEADSVFYDYFKNNLNRCIGYDSGDTNFDLDYIRENVNVGPGASILAPANDFVTKFFNGPISHTSKYLVSLYRSAIIDSEIWASAEAARFKMFPFVKVNGGKLFFAKKNAEISRTCCTEPSLNLMFQKAVCAFLEYRLKKHYGISLALQPDYNRELARVGSVDGSFGTIDLVSASDSISWQLMQNALENGFLKAIFREARCEKAVLPDGSEVVLKMISTMGNAFTFPLQTVIFASAVRAVYQMMNLKSSDPSTQFGVFGDDIIVSREAYDVVCRMLTKLGFEVNTAKSFNTGSFRESCGSDYFSGTNVRGVYIRDLETPQAVCSAINRLLDWSARHGIPLTRTIGSLRSLLPWKLNLVPPSCADDEGIKVPFRATRPRLTDSYWFKYRFYKRIVKRVSISPDEELRHPNPHGLGCAILAGAVGRRDVSLTDLTKRTPEGVLLGWDISMTYRDGFGARPRYRVVSSSLPYWDYRPRKGYSIGTVADQDDGNPLSLSRHGGSKRGFFREPSYRIWEDTVMAALAIS